MQFLPSEIRKHITAGTYWGVKMTPKKGGASRKKLTPLKTGKVIKAFEKLGYRQTAHNQNKHLVLRKKGVVFNLAIPIHGKETPVGVIRSLINKAGLTVQEFLDVYSKI